MDFRLDRRMREIVKTRLPVDGAIATEQIREQLEQEGINPPDGAMDEVVDMWSDKRLVEGPRPLNRDGHLKHGSMVITKILSRRF
jgi:hypothetical protein